MFVKRMWSQLLSHDDNKKNACGANISCGIACETMNFITMALFIIIFTLCTVPQPQYVYSYPPQRQCSQPNVNSSMYWQQGMVKQRRISYHLYNTELVLTWWEFLTAYKFRGYIMVQRWYKNWALQTITAVWLGN